MPRIAAFCRGVVIKAGKRLYIENMKKFIPVLTFTLSALALSTFAACSKKIDYFSFVSEYRHDVYIYEDDKVSLKIFLSDKETPYVCDGVKGETSPVCEIYYKPAKTPQSAEIDIGGLGGEMNYMSVTRTFYLSFAYDKTFGTEVEAKITADGESFDYTAGNVREEGTIDGVSALKCVTDYDGEQFSSLTEGKNFRGEIGIRLLYDGGCYYYVGVSDREGNTHAYLLDASDGRIISERKSEDV